MLVELGESLLCRGIGGHDCDVVLMPNARYRRIVNIEDLGAQT